MKVKADKNNLLPGIEEYFPYYWHKGYKVSN